LILRATANMTAATIFKLGGWKGQCSLTGSFMKIHQLQQEARFLVGNAVAGKPMPL